MGILDLFRKRERRVVGYSDQDIEVVAQAARDHARVVNESMRIAGETKNPATKASRLIVARDTLERLKDMAVQFEFLTLPNLAETEKRLAELERGTGQDLAARYRGLAQSNMKGQDLEKQGRVEEAIHVYEALAAQKTDTPFTYRRLAIIYRKQKRYSDEVRILKLAIKNIPKYNPQHHAWFVDRHAKALTKLQQSG